jgi:hypothetical protein
MGRVSEDWISCTMRTVEAIMERHGFVEDIVPKVELSAEQSTKAPDWNKLLRRLPLIRVA